MVAWGAQDFEGFAAECKTSKSLAVWVLLVGLCILHSAHSIEQVFFRIHIDCKAVATWHHVVDQSKVNCMVSCWNDMTMAYE